MDVKAMDFPEASFDAVVDKATLDSVLVSFIIMEVWGKFNCQRK